jgi:hypothetical protein
MTPNANDQFTFVAVGTKTTLASPGYSEGDDSLNCVDLSKWTIASDKSAVFFGIDRVDDTGTRIPGTYTEWKGVVADNTIGSLQLQDGFVDQDYAAGTNTRVFMLITQSWANSIVTGLLGLMNQDSTLKNEVVGSDSLKPSAVTTAKIASAAVTDDKWRNSISFSARKTGTQSIAAAAFVKTTCTIVEWDISNNYDEAYSQFKVPFKGIYHFDGFIATPNDTNRVFASIYVNGSEKLRGTNGNWASTANRATVSGDLLLNENDLVELYAWRGGAGTIIDDGAPQYGCRIQGHLVTRVA